MKTFLTLFSVFSLSSASVHASTIQPPEYYSAHFEVEKIEPMCPKDIPAGAVCMGLGSVVTVKAYIGCADKLLFSEFDTINSMGSVDIFAVSVVKKHPDAGQIRCIKPNEVRKQFTVDFGEINTDIFHLDVK